MGQTAVNPFSLAGPKYQGNWGGNFADGGIVMPRPGGLIGRIGEAGKAEAVIPLDRLETMIGKGSGTTVVIQGNVGWDPDTVARKIAQKQAQINGLAGLNGIIGVR